MATIQIKRRISGGSGPLTGAIGNIKAGEPQIDFSGKHLYIAKTNKTASTTVPLVKNDYLEFPEVTKVDDQIEAKITALALGSAALKDTGTASGNVVVLDTNGKIADSVIPKIALTNTFVVASQVAMLALSNAQEGDVAVRSDLKKTFILKKTGSNILANWQELLSPTDAVTSVNGSTGVVSISLAGLGGVALSSYNAHVSSNAHLTATQRTILSSVRVSEIVDAQGTKLALSDIDLSNNVISDGIKFLPVIDTTYTPSVVKYKLGIDSSKVLTPASVIDGGTY